jgi:hypothetical protein
MDFDMVLGKDNQGQEVAAFTLTTQPIDTRQLLRLIRSQQPDAWRDVEREIIIPAADDRKPFIPD